MMTPNVLIVRTAGTNCDRELASAFNLAGAATRTAHLNQLIDGPEQIREADIIGFPGGFSYGDDIAAGRILANRLRHRLMGPLQDAVGRGVPIIGICNGFQVLVKLGLLPGGDQAGQKVTLADNTSGRFIDRWVKLHANASSHCIWTQKITSLDLPVAHGEGRLVVESHALATQLRDRGQIALRYAPNDNPNGSIDDIAGLCDPSGLILGLMPHPERYTHLTHHPLWTRGYQPDYTGLALFEAAVAFVRSKQQAPIVSHGKQFSSGPLPLC